MANLPQTRQSLLIRLKDQSEEAWPEFLAIYEKSIVDYARRKGLQDADARDVTQDVLSAVEKKVKSWDCDPSKGKFRGWLFRVARNIAVDKVIQQSRTPVSGGTNVARILAEHANVQENETVEFWKDFRRQLLHWAAAKVRPQVTETSWRAFWMTAMEGSHGDEVAKALGISRGNVYAAKLRITARIQKLAQGFDDPDAFANRLNEEQNG